ncbi:MAG TPA: hypothetical protein PKD72_13440, partial [Gemmatales bacterium]|nr:hypothetical protein [Gemmatales bacterium]
MIRAKSLAWIGGVGLLGMSPAAVLAQGLPLPPAAPDNSVPVQVAPPSQEVVQTGGDRSLKPRDILKDGVENHRKFEFELADVYLKKAQELRASLSASEQKELDAYLQSNAKALAARKQGQEMIQKATVAINAGQYQEADALLRSLKANTYLGTQDRQSVATLSEVLAKNTGMATTPANVAATTPKGKTPADMLAAGRAAFKNKNYDEAQVWALNAKQMGYTKKLPFDDDPDKLMNDIQVARAQAAKSTPVANASMDQRQQQCKQLCMQAQNALNSGDIATAKRLVKQAEDLQVNVAWFDEFTPAKVNEAIARAEHAGVRAGNTVVANVADPKQTLKEARAALEQGNFDRAEELCNSLRVAKVSYGFFDDTHDKVLADVRKARETVNSRKAADLLVQARKHLEAGQFDDAEKCCA